MDSKGKRRQLDAPALRKILAEKEPEANIIIAKIMGALAIVYLVTWILFLLQFFRGDTILSDIALLGNAVLILISATICLIRKGRDKWIKYLLMFITLVSVFEINVLTGYKVWMIYAIPIIITCRYYSVNLIVVTNIVSSLLIIASAFCDAYISPLFGYIDLNTVSFPNGAILEISEWLYKPVTSSMLLDSNTILKNTLRLSTVPNLLIMLFVSIACIAVIKQGQETMLEVNAITEQEAAMELEVSNERAKIMLSQIQPHFLYNTLTAIMAIDGNPDETVEAIGEFGKYLRENMDVLTSGDVVSFSKEMQHVRRYISLEQLRFKEKIKIVYDVDVISFSVPALTVQMLVENSIKHGITKKSEGGCVWIRSKETDKEYLVVVEDNGVGFDPDKLPDPKNHVGLVNVRSRLENICGGNLEIDSKPGDGTVAIVHIPKERSL